MYHLLCLDMKFLSSKGSYVEGLVTNAVGFRGEVWGN
jgi:hypothetical protein